MTGALVIGGGPAGLMAAAALLTAGCPTVLAEAMPTVGRKFLMAGKSGLNLTKQEEPDQFAAQYGDAMPALRPILDRFGPDDVQDWARGLGQPLFVGSTGRVFPEAMKASPLLRAWLARLRDQGLEVRSRWRWRGWEDGFAFDTPEGPQQVLPSVCVLALGGASWRRLGSDGAWAAWLGPVTAPFAASNVGLRVEWSGHMNRHFGQPLKGCAFRAGGQVSRGEAVISARGLEGGGIYALSAPLRAGAALQVDLFPDLTEDALRQRLNRPRGKASLPNHLRKALRLEGVRLALFQEFARPLPDDLAPVLKALPIAHAGPRDIDEAISTVGGVRWDALDAGLMLRDRPGVFCAGEMIDWDAPTGGYLLTACLATGRWAGQAAAHYARQFR